ncbi:uncharacterized protein [Centruroides vittatus]|uniref:uncharacterized protein n=1 Tax=Centruroides vittatus TaxID=120091 RepID=UPI00350F0BA1
MFLSTDLIKFADNVDDCRNQCEQEPSFNCRSYSYVDNKCFLSSDGTSTLGFEFLKEESGVIFGEKKCVVDRCNDGTITFEKITGYILRSSVETNIEIPRTGSTWLQGITLDCWKHCKESTDDCPAFTVSYQTQRCQKLDRNSQGRIGDLTPRPGGNYFEKICLRGTQAEACKNKAWAFERVPAFELEESLYDRHIPNVQNRSECEELCLREITFVCRSAFYHEDDLICKLSREDRRTQSQKYHTNNNIRTSYLENSCIPVLTTCPYEHTLDHYSTYTDTVHRGAIQSHSDCEKVCDDFQGFNCRSYAYYSAQGQCFFSGDDTVSVGGKKLSLQPRQGITYFERNCNLTTEITTGTPSRPPPTTVPPPTAPKTVCASGQKLTFEKLIGFESIGSYPIYLYRSTFQIPGITLECLRKCELDSDCESFVLDYERFECYRFSDFGPVNIRPNKGKSYFKALCISALIPCEKLWAVDILMDRELRVSRPVDVIRQVNREECARRCLEERRFRCRSSNYYSFRRECTLSTEDKNSPVAELHFSAGVDYIENQCISETSNCPYQSPEIGIYMWYVDRTLHGIITSQQCEEECDRERAFNCRSYSHVDGTGEFKCLLSSDNKESLPNTAFELRHKSLFAQKDCKNQITRSVPRETPILTPPVVSPTQRPGVCTFDRYTYEKIVGYDPRLLRKHRIPIIDSVGILGQCQHECQRMGERCKGFVILYTPVQICYWLEVAASEITNALMPSPLAAYYEKVCLRDMGCGKYWTFERVIGHQMKGTALIDIPSVLERTDCEDLCIRDKNCLSANYFYKLKLCRLFSESRRSQPSAVVKSEDVDYLENQCIKEPPTCQYKDYPDRFFPFIDRLSRAHDIHDCQKQCDLERRFRCRSINYETMTRHCALSSEDLATVGDSTDLLQFRRQSIFSEKGNCEQVSVQCNQQDMILTVNFAVPFNGRVYAKGNPAQCYMLGTGQQSLQFAVSMGSRCGTKLEGPDLYVNEVVIQQHPVIMTDNDKTIRVMCSFEPRERTYTLGNPLQSDHPAMEVATLFQHPIKSVVTNTVPPPNVVMRVLDHQGQDARRVGLGDELTLRIELREINSAFALHAKNLYARSTKGESLFLIDGRGCPNDPSIFPTLQVDQRDGKSLYANFKAFRFPSTGMVNFEVQIKFCQDRCEPVICRNGARSHGRRKRSLHDNSNQEILSLTTQFPFQKNQTFKNNYMLNSSLSTNTSAIFERKSRLKYQNVTAPKFSSSTADFQKRNFMRTSNFTREQNIWENYSNVVNNSTSKPFFQSHSPRELTPSEMSNLNRHYSRDQDYTHSYDNRQFDRPSEGFGPHYREYHQNFRQDFRPNSPHPPLYPPYYNNRGTEHQYNQFQFHYTDQQFDDHRMRPASHPRHYHSSHQVHSSPNFQIRDRPSNDKSFSELQSSSIRVISKDREYERPLNNHNGPISVHSSTPYSQQQPVFNPQIPKERYDFPPNVHNVPNSPMSQNYPSPWPGFRVSNPDQTSNLHYRHPYNNNQHSNTRIWTSNNAQPSREETKKNSSYTLHHPSSIRKENRNFSRSPPVHTRLPSPIHPPILRNSNVKNSSRPSLILQPPPNNSQTINMDRKNPINAPPYLNYPSNGNMNAGNRFPPRNHHWKPEENKSRPTYKSRPPQNNHRIPPKDEKRTNLPDELPLSFAIMVGEDQPMADKSAWTLERKTIPPPTVLPETSEDTVCTSKTTVVVTVTAVTVLYIGAAIAAIFFYRWRRKQKRKKRRYIDPQPRSQPNNADVTYASPEVTFRSIYGAFPNES